MTTQPSRLDAGADFLASTGPSHTNGMVKGGAQLKISPCAKITGGAYSPHKTGFAGTPVGSAIRQASEARRLDDDNNR